MKFKKPVFTNEKTYKINDIKGIATSQHISSVGLDRLSDGENIWNKESVLASRPGLAVTKNGIISDFSVFSDFVKVFYADFPLNAVNGYNRIYAVAKEDVGFITEIDFFVADSNGQAHRLKTIEFVGANGNAHFEIKNILFVKDTPMNGCGIFILIPIKRWGEEGEDSFVRYYELNSDYNNLIEADPRDFYRPLILKHGFGNAASAEVRNGRTTAYPEGVNILGGNFEACFTTDDRSHIFDLPTPVAEDARIEIRLYSTSLSYVTFIIPARSSSSETTTFMQKDINVYINRATGHFEFYSNGEPYGVPSMLSENGLRVLSYADTAFDAYELLSRNSRPLNFDNRIFLPGGENRGDKIYYSGKNKPLYFSEKNCIPVGNNNYDVTALSMQSRYVIAFKEKEIYRLTLSESNELDRDTLFLDNNVLETPVPSYKITRINDSIGCDLPSTIVNCANRLVWFHSDGIVYTLYGSNLYTEGSIYELSGEISDRISNLSEEDLNFVFAAELKGFYVLGINDVLYIMDTRVSGFRYLSGYKTSKEKYGGLPWFIWESPQGAKFVSAFVCGGNEYFIMRTDNKRILYIASPTGEKDIVPQKNDEPLESLPEFSLSTPIFGDSLLQTNKITINATAKNDISIDISDENGIFKTAQIKGSDRFRSFVLPLSYKKGGVGITIKGRGKFTLKDIVTNFSERKY